MTEVHLSILAFFLLLMPCIPALCGRPQRNKNLGIQDILAAERLNKWGELDKKHCQPKPYLRRNAKRIKVMDGLSDLNSEDNDEYQIDTDNSTSEANDVSDNDISNGEVSARLSIVFIS